MPKLNLRRYDVQARVSVGLSAVSVVFVIAAIAAVFAPSGGGGYDWSTNTIVYRSGSLRWVALMGSAAVAVALSLTGLSFGANSAGQRRNDKQKLSWIGFFVGAAMLLLTILLLTLFLLRGDPV